MSVLTDFAAQAYTCLVAAFDGAPAGQVPANFQRFPGIQKTPDISQFQDQCCEGLAYMRMVRAYPSADFPQEDPGPMPPCGPYAVAAVVEMGIFRCAPVGDSDFVVSNDAWDATFDQQMLDYGYLYKAMCCVKTLLEGEYRTDSVQFIDWAPFEIEGNCSGSRIQFAVQLECPNSDC